MKEPIPAMRLTSFRSVSLPVLTFALAFAPACVKSAPPSLEGIHIHRSGSAPHFLKTTKMSLDGLEGQCKGLKKICSITPAGAPPDVVASCAAVAGVSGFSFKGNIADVGNVETDEYFSPTLKMAARKTRKSVLNIKTICDIEVVQQEDREIWHYTPTGYTHYELKQNPKKGSRWVRSAHRNLPQTMGALLAGVLPLSASTTVSPVRGHKTYAGHTCEERTFAGPWSGTLCLKSTTTPFPGHIKLAGTVVANKDTLLDDAATEVHEKIMLPYNTFYPPAGVMSGKSAAPASAENATQKWCLKQKMKTGVNPCEEESDDE